MTSINRELLFLISDVGRLLRTRADQKARLVGMTRAQWAVLLRLQRMEGQNQADLAEQLDIQPITLTRLVDRLCENGLIERRPDPADRRAKLLYLTPAARPLIERIEGEIEDLGEAVLQGIDFDQLQQFAAQLGLARENLRRAIQTNPQTNKDKTEQRYG